MKEIELLAAVVLLHAESTKDPVESAIAALERKRLKIRKARKAESTLEGKIPLMRQESLIEKLRLELRGSFYYLEEYFNSL